MKNDKTIIRSRYTDHVSTYTETGRPMHNNYQIRINKTGHKELYKIGEHNLQAEINAAAEEVSIKTILERVKGGDIEALNRAKAGYVDLTKCPKDLREAQDTVLKIKNEFKELPVDIRKEFDHSPEKYVAEYGNKEWIHKMGFDKKEPEQIPYSNETEKKIEKEGEKNE